LTAALRSIGEQETGMVLYLRQEGRGIGLLNKLRAYGLQDEGLDTVDANIALGFRDDERDYSIAAHMLALLRVRSIRLMTNNPRKVDGLRELGIDVSGRIPHVIPANKHNRSYLETKALRSGHLIDVAGREHLLEQIDRPILEGMSQDAIDAIEQLDPVEAQA
jgi:GTP cyclohydrolase II